MNILLDNAIEAWMDATTCADLLKDGVSTLGYKKRFVSSLHNAVELYLKQILLDNCDYRIALVKQVDKDGQPLKKLYSSKDLNHFFKNLSAEERKRFYTIDFSELITILKTNNYLNNDYSEALKKLNSLRNNETHFYINNEDYLSDSEFLMLYNFMVDFCDEIYKKHLLYPDFRILEIPTIKVYSRKEKLQSFHYSSAIKRSKVSKDISKALKDVQVSSMAEMGTLLFMDETWDYIKSVVFPYEKAWAYIESLFNANAIRFEKIELMPVEAEILVGTYTIIDRGFLEISPDEIPNCYIKIKTIK